MKENIIRAVQNGAMGFMINKNSTNYEKMVNTAKQIKKIMVTTNNSFYFKKIKNN